MPAFVYLFSLLGLSAAALSASAQSAPAGGSAQEVLTQLESEAAAGNRHILLEFGASWCGNCKLFDLFLNDPAMHPILSKAFVFGEMATGENPNQTRHLNLPGGPELQATYGGSRSGWPYLVMLDEHGKLLASSDAPKSGNIGYPATPGEIGWFVQMLRRSAPSVTPAELRAVQSWLTAHSPEGGRG